MKKSKAGTILFENVQVLYKLSDFRSETLKHFYSLKHNLALEKKKVEDEVTKTFLLEDDLQQMKNDNIGLHAKRKDC